MKEITRIHIAKVAYDIELNAKKELESYIAALERYAGDKELLDDIEIRITELLAERDVRADGVISSDDVAAVRAQLGEPSDFATEDAVITPEPQETSEPRRVYRDQDDALLGGVLSGFGKFFGVDPLWVRLLFIVVLFASFGTALVVYLILWLIIPPARTAAEKLSMSGRPVTLASIKAFSESVQPNANDTAMTVRRILRIGTGLALVAGSIAALGIVGTVVSHLLLGTRYGGPQLNTIAEPDMLWALIALGLFSLAGLLLASLGLVLANATFRRIWNKRMTIAVSLIIVAGLLAFGGGVGTVFYGQMNYEARLNENRRTSSINLPANFANIQKLSLLADENDTSIGMTDITVQYIISDKPRYELVAPDGVRPVVIIADDSLSATLKVTKNDTPLWRSHGYLGATELKVYGPVLRQVDTAASSPSMTYDADQPQDTFSLNAKGLSFDLLGTYDTVTIMNDQGARVTADKASIVSLMIDSKSGTTRAGVVRSLTVTMPDACPTPQSEDEPNAAVYARAVSGNEMTFNKATLPAVTTKTDCGKIIVGNEGEEQ